MPWMTDLFYDPQLTADTRGPFGNRPLRQICIPGTHDSGCYATYTLSLNILSRTQTLNVAGQLAGGIRYFDIRPCFYGNDIYTYHGPAYYGDRIDGDHGILAQLRDFMKSLAATDTELVILNVAHFYKFDAQKHQTLITTIGTMLGDYLVPFNQSEISLFNVPYQSLLTNSRGNMRSRVAIIYDGALDEDREPYITQLIGGGAFLPQGFFTVSPKYDLPAADMEIRLFDKYSNRIHVSNIPIIQKIGMRTDQLDKLQKRDTFPYTKKGWGDNLASKLWTADAPQGVRSTLHLLSWTLTPQPFGEPIPYARDSANPALLEFLADQRNWVDEHDQRGYYDAMYNPQINIVYVDDFDSELHNNRNSVWHGMAQPVAIAARINVGPVGPENTW